MTREERAEKAVLFKHSGCNCTQAVVMAFQEEMELSPETIMVLTSGFQGGMGCMGATCGALIGAVLVADKLINGAAAPKTARAMFNRFNELSGAAVCRDLKGIDTGTVLCPCDDCVRNGVYAIYDIVLAQQ